MYDVRLCLDETVGVRWDVV